MIDEASLYVKQLAWLQAVPNAPEPKGRTAPKIKAEKQMSRLERMDLQGLPLPLPPAGPAAYLTQYLFDAGPACYGAMGPVPLSHLELAAWQSNSGIELAAWEAQALRRLSGDYVAASQAAQAPDCPPYWIDAATVADQRPALADAARSIFGGRAKPAQGAQP